MAQPKELDFFSVNYDRGLDWYASHFADQGRAIHGEISPLYMDHAEVAARISESYPDVKILAVLRDPFQRAVSNLLHVISRVDGSLTAASKERAQQMARQDEMYVRRSCYAAALAPYVERFGLAQLKILFYEDLRRNQSQFIRDLYSAVGADPEFTPTGAEQVVNKTADYVSPALFRLIRKTSQAAKAWGPTSQGMHWIYRHTHLREWALANLSIDRGKPPLTFSDIFGLDAAARIRDDVQRLSSDLKLEVPSQWLKRADSGGSRENAA